jgi:hypothetical protein
MGSSDRDGDDAKGADAEARRALERSPEGRFVIRSSSHPPTEQTGSVDVSGVHNRPDRPGPRERVVERPAERAREGRDATPTGRKSTPAERPRKRRALQDAVAAQVDLRARCDTPRALPGERPSQRPSHQGSTAPARPAPMPMPTAAVADPQAPLDEVTRRVRRPGSNPPSNRWSNPQRAVVAAIALVALAALAMSLLR